MDSSKESNLLKVLDFNMSFISLYTEIIEPSYWTQSLINIPVVYKLALVLLFPHLWSVSTDVLDDLVVGA